MNKLGQDLRRERERNLRLENLALEKIVGRLVRRQLRQLELD